ncbi:MAG TPA: DnaB-like helicase N-terminal domain-containing protein, partial [Syntrophorhabdaceae bacterium]|nr:DnaB-like helicase N-terminal domain-containing protein [Syntrophorhabdaceae bacterium]
MQRQKTVRQERKDILPPQNIEAEQSLLGGLLVDSEAINRVIDMVSPEDFYRDAHAKLFKIISDLYERNEAIDIITVTSFAKDRGLLEDIG